MRSEAPAGVPGVARGMSYLLHDFLAVLCDSIVVFYKRVLLLLCCVVLFFQPGSL